VLAAWFTRCSSTGSRRESSTEPTQPALPPQRSSERAFFEGAASSKQATGCLEQASGKADEVVFASPDTGQRGGDALAHRCDVHALSGKAVRALCLSDRMKIKRIYALGVSAAACAVFSTNPLVAQTLETQVVIASRFVEPLAEVLPAVSVITRKEIEQQNFDDIFSVLQGIPGVELSRMGGPGNPISIYSRGASSSQTLVLVDGIPFSAQGSIGALSPLETIPLQLIERIEILRGNASAVYGPGAVGGVIQIFTEQGGASQGAHAAMTVGSKGTQQLAAGWSGNVDDTRLQFSIGQNSSRGIEALSHSKYPAVNPGLNGYRNDFVNGSLTHAFSAATKLKLHYTGSLLSSVFDNNYAASSADQWKNRSKTEVLGLQLDQRLSNRWHSKLQLSQSLNDQSTLTNDQLNATYGTFITKHQTLQWGNDYELTSRDLLSFGFNSTRSLLDANHTGFMTISPYDEVPVSVNSSIGTQRIYTGLNAVRDRWNFQASLGHEMLPHNIQGNTYLLGAGYQLGGGYKATVTRSNALQSPTVGQLYDVSFGGSQTLRPEKSKSFEVGLQYNNQQSQWRVIAFKSDYTDLIAVGNTRVTDPFWASQDIKQLENVDKAKNSGFETSYKQRFGRLNIGFNFTHQTPVNVDSTVAVMNKSKNFGAFNADYALDAKTNVSMKLFSTSQRKTFAPDYSRVDTAGYAVLNLGYKRALDRSWTATASINNALDRTYFHVAGYNNLPRTYMLGLRYQGQ
jgi:vitamin B12 transporter